MLITDTGGALVGSFNLYRLQPSPNTLRAADIGLNALCNLLVVFQSAQGLPQLKDVRILVNTARGLQAFLSQSMRAQLSPRRIFGSHDDRAKFVAMIDTSNHFFMDPFLLLVKHSPTAGSYLESYFTMRNVPGSISKLHENVKWIKSLADFYAADENVFQSLCKTDPEALLRSDVRMLKSVADIAFLIIGLLVGSRLRAGLTVVSAAIAAYKLYVDTR